MKKKEGCFGGDYQTRTNPQPHTGHAQNVVYSSGKGTNFWSTHCMFQNFFLPPFASRMGSSPGHCSTGRAQLLCVSLCPSQWKANRQETGKQKGQGENVEEWEWERKLGVTWMWRRAGFEGAPGLVPGRIAKRVKCGFVLTLSGSRMPSLHPWHPGIISSATIY